MSESFKKNKKLLGVLIHCLIITIIIFSSAGCINFRKKFIRQKNKGDTGDEMIPVLEPVDYSSKPFLAQERYSYHFSFWKVWSQEIVQSISNDDSDKRQKYIFNQLFDQLEAMEKWLKGEKKEELIGVINDLKKIEAEFKKPLAMRNGPSLIRKLERHANKVRRDFNPKYMDGYYIY